MRLTALTLTLGLMMTPAVAWSGDPTPASPELITLTLKDHRFSPAQVSVPAGRQIQIELINDDNALEEFDSQDLGVEKDVAPHRRIRFSIGPLSAGDYDFMGELHPDTATGVIHAVADSAAAR